MKVIKASEGASLKLRVLQPMLYGLSRLKCDLLTLFSASNSWDILEGTVNSE